MTNHTTHTHKVEKSFYNNLVETISDNSKRLCSIVHYSVLTGKHLALPDPSAFGHFHPAGHVRQTSAPPTEKDPGEQGISVEFVVDGQYLPAGQAVQY